jgi:hypothetical protein
VDKVKYRESLLCDHDIEMMEIFYWVFIVCSFVHVQVNLIQCVSCSEDLRAVFL